MKIRTAVASGGRFHAFEIAEQANRNGTLDTFYCGFPRWKIPRSIIDKSKTHFLPFIPSTLASRLGAGRLKIYLGCNATQAFDRWVSASLRPCDIFHCLSGFGISAASIARARFGAKTICDRGSSHIKEQNAILSAEYKLWNLPFPGIPPSHIDRELIDYEQADLIFVPSRFALESFVKHGISRSKLRRIAYGVDLLSFVPKPKADDKFRVIYTGELSLRKGIPYLLEAFSKVARSGAELWLIGRVLDEVKPFLKRYEGIFRLFDSQPRSALPSFYSQGSVFVMSSVEEGLALVQAQAMACGLPIIGTANSGAEDLITNGKEGFVLPIRRSDLLSESIVYLRDNPVARKEMARAALKKVQQIGGWESYGLALDKQYRALVSTEFETSNT